MIVESIHVTNFLSHKESTIDFTGTPLWLVFGENGAGKSALLDALEYALYGSHRGGRPSATAVTTRQRAASQNSELLVKHGAARATVSAVIRLNGSGSPAYRIRHEIDAEKGNRGGRVDRWDGPSNKWRPINIGSGVSAAWNWLADRLPRVDEFHSAIYLRQGETGHFLGGGATERAKRFAQLIDFTRYRDLASRAQQRSKASEDQIEQLRGRLTELGDVSEDAVRTATTAVRDAIAAAKVAAKNVAAAAAVTTGAREWQRTLDERARIAGQRETLLTLLAQGDDIRKAATRVARWDRASAALERYRTATRAAVKLEGERRLAATRAADAETALEKASREAEEVRSRIDEINAEKLPQARLQSEHARTKADEYALELKISRAREELEKSNAALARYRGKDRELEEWRALDLALPQVEALVLAASTTRQAADNVEREALALAKSQGRFERACSESEKAVELAEGLTKRAAEARQKLDDVANQVAHLKGRIGGHQRLAGQESECPTCAQPLDADAHAHVAQVLASETAALKGMQATLRAAKQTLDHEEGARNAATMGITAAERKVRDAEREVALTTERLNTRRAALESATEQFSRARDIVRMGHPTYAHLGVPSDNAVSNGVPDDAWLRGERGRINLGVTATEADAASLRRAHDIFLRAEAGVETLRKQRPAAAEALGEAQAPGALERVLAHAEKTQKDAREVTTKLETEREKVQKRAQEIAATSATLRASVKDETRRATEKSSAAEEARSLASTTAIELGSEWADILASEDSYSAELVAVNAVRSQAARLGELDEARGQLAELDKRLLHLETEAGRIESAHRIAIKDAEDQEAAVRQVKADVDVAHAKAVDHRQALDQNRTNAIRYQHDLVSLAQQRDTYAELADLLRDGGPIQMYVAEHEQGLIVGEVNAVLAQLGDPLLVRLGDPRRRHRVQFQDIHILDTHDPSANARYYEFLSGGEKFRVALALALALHRRVGRRPGTIIVDEGFGALDGARRDALAIQLTNASQGILNLGLAESIIICSHSAEIQRHFPDRWLITKDGGTATVVRAGVSDDA